MYSGPKELPQLAVLWKEMRRLKRGNNALRDSQQPQEILDFDIHVRENPTCLGQIMCSIIDLKLKIFQKEEKVRGLDGEGQLQRIISKIQLCVEPGN